MINHDVTDEDDHEAEALIGMLNNMAPAVGDHNAVGIAAPLEQG
jgi:hypothetical protein